MREVTIKNIQGVIVPGGFGSTGIENMITFIKTLREENIPTLGICLGMQLMVIEFCRNILGMNNAGSSEFEGYSPNVISKMDHWSSLKYGGTMRLGNSQIQLKEFSKIIKIYKKRVSKPKR